MMDTLLIAIFILGNVAIATEHSIKINKAAASLPGYVAGSLTYVLQHQILGL